MSESRVFVARVPEEPFMEISSGGAFVNPITASFALRDTQETKTVTEKLYVVVVNRLLSQVILRSIGTLSGCKVELSWNGNEDGWASQIEQEVNLDATDTIPLSVPFYARFTITDNMDSLPLDQYRNNLQIRLIYI